MDNVDFRSSYVSKAAPCFWDIADLAALKATHDFLHFFIDLFAALIR